MSNLTTRDRIDRLRVSSPCPTSWERMNGDDRVRFCDLCKLNVYNLSELTRKQAMALIAGTEGRLCARLYRRADGTVLTKDCPVGLRALHRRVSRVAGAAIAACFSFCMGVIGQTRAQEDTSIPARTQIVSRASIMQLQDNRSILSGVVKDIGGAAVPGAVVTLINPLTKQRIVVSTNSDGLFKFVALQAGVYNILVEATGFETTKVEKFDIQPNQEVSTDLTLNMGEHVIWIGIIAEVDPMLDTTTSSNKTIFTQKQITRLPF